MNFTTQKEKNEAIEKQQEVVDNAKPEADQEAKDKLAEIKNATVGA